MHHKSKLECPWLREELIWYLTSLSDLDYQKNCWIKENCPGDIQFDNFGQSIHFFYDDMQLDIDIEGALGLFLSNDKEVIAIRNVMRVLNVIYDEYTFELEDAEVIELPEWKYVIEAAQQALKILKNNRQKL